MRTDIPRPIHKTSHGFYGSFALDSNRVCFAASLCSNLGSCFYCWTSPCSYEPQALIKGRETKLHLCTVKKPGAMAGLLISLSVGCGVARWLRQPLSATTDKQVSQFTQRCCRHPSRHQNRQKTHHWRPSYPVQQAPQLVPPLRACLRE